MENLSVYILPIIFGIFIVPKVRVLHPLCNKPIYTQSHQDTWFSFSSAELGAGHLTEPAHPYFWFIWYLW